MQATIAEQPSSQWMRLSEVSQMLGIDYDTILYAVRKASACAEPWVTRAPHPLPSSPVCWLVDITHPSYQCLEQRWRKHLQRTGPMQAFASTTSNRAEHSQPQTSNEQILEPQTEGMIGAPACSDAFAFQGDDPFTPVTPFDAFPEVREQKRRPHQKEEALLELSTRCTCHGLSVDLTTAWPEFCQLLSEQGLIVFADALTPAARWQWVWQDDRGEGYADATDAIIAALSSHFTTHFDPDILPDPGDAPFIQGDQEETPASSWWHRLFSRS